MLLQQDVFVVILGKDDDNVNGIKEIAVKHVIWEILESEHYNSYFLMFQGSHSFDRFNNEVHEKFGSEYDMIPFLIKKGRLVKRN